MRLSVIINTVAGTKDPEILQRAGSFGHEAKHPYARRAERLEQTLAEYAKHPWFQTIVVGEWHDGDSYLYLPHPGPTKSPLDPPAQRHAAAQLAAGDCCVFMNDDHYIMPLHLQWLQEITPTCHVTAFGRYCYRNSQMLQMEDGFMEHSPENQYCMGHAVACSRVALQAVPWASLKQDINWDVYHTIALRQASMSIQYIPHLIAWDIEEGEFPIEQA